VRAVVSSGTPRRPPRARGPVRAPLPHPPRSRPRADCAPGGGARGQPEPVPVPSRSHISSALRAATALGDAASTSRAGTLGFLGGAALPAAAQAGAGGAGDAGGGGWSRAAFGAGALALAGAASVAGTALADAPAPAAAAAAAPARWAGGAGDLTLYQYEVCPFCCKAKAALDYYGVPYKVVEVNPITKAQLKALGGPPDGGKPKVPVLVADGEAIRESNEIMDRVREAARAAGTDPGARRRGWLGGGAGGGEGDEARDRAWRDWSDERFVRVVTVNIYRTWAESLQTFDYISRECHWGPLETAVVKYAGAAIMYFVSRRMVSKYGLEGDAREQLFALSNEWTDAVGAADFLAGARPGLADLSVFGVLQAVRGTDAFTELLEVTRIKPWYMRMVGAVGKSRGRRVGV